MFSSTHGLLPLSLWCRIPLKIDGTFLDLLGDTLDDSEIPPGLRELAKAGVPVSSVVTFDESKLPRSQIYLLLITFGAFLNTERVKKEIET